MDEAFIIRETVSEEGVKFYKGCRGRVLGPPNHLAYVPFHLNGFTRAYNVPYDDVAPESGIFSFVHTWLKRPATICSSYTTSPVDPTGPKFVSTTISEQLKGVRDDLKTCDEDFPHRCPHCDAAAYVGLNKVWCKAKCERSAK